MDKELLRVVIIATGLVVIMGMLAWHFIKHKKSSRDMNFFDEEEILGNIKESLATHPEHDDFGIVSKKPAGFDVDHKTDQLFKDFDDQFEFEDDESAPSPRFVTPDIIQFSIVSKTNEGFNGLDLFKAFQIVGLEFGHLKIFERLDADRRVEFAVACMVEPGTFPNTQLETFFCPGVVFFMQPGVLDHPSVIFDDFIETIHLLALELDGYVLDHQRKPLSDTTVQLIRQSL